MTEKQGSRFQDLNFFSTSINRLCTMKYTSNMKEFVFASYLYIDNFMFGRHVEKQQVWNTLLQDNLTPFARYVLPIIGGIRVGKKTLVAHVCNNEKVMSRFSSILHKNGENICLENAA
jgi:hypothetical protein